MPDATEELDPLLPTPWEIGLSVVSVVHLTLVVVVVVRLLRGRMTMPHGIWGVIVLLLLPVVGPLLVLTWQGRVDRHHARVQQRSSV